MSEKTITVTLSEPAFRRLQRASAVTHRSLDDIVMSALNVTLSVPPDLPVELPVELADELAAMTMLSDAALWASIESLLSPTQQRRLRQMTRAGGTRTLTAAESAELAQLLEVYDRSVLRRARAFALLTYRGYALPDRVDVPDSFADDNGDHEDTPAPG